MAVIGFNEFIQSLAQTDFFTGILPFALSFLVFFLASDKVPILDEKKFRIFVSLILSFFVANFLAANPAYAAFYQSYFGGLAFGLIGILGLFISLAFVGLSWDNYQGAYGLLLLSGLVVAGAISIGAVDAFALTGPSVDVPGVDPDLGTINEILFEEGGVYLLLFLALVGFFIYDPDDQNNGNNGNNGGVSLSDVLEALGNTPNNNNNIT